MTLCVRDSSGSPLQRAGADSPTARRVGAAFVAALCRVLCAANGAAARPKNKKGLK